MLNRRIVNTLVHVPVNKEIISFEVQIKVDVFIFSNIKKKEPSPYFLVNTHFNTKLSLMI